MELIKKGMNGKAFTLELMMRGTRDGFSAKMFHEELVLVMVFFCLFSDKKLYNANVLQQLSRSW